MAVSAQAQVTADEAIKKVYETLSLKQSNLSGDTLQLLKNGAWEALAYLNETDLDSANKVSEAVPDYYNFRESNAVIKLIDQKDINVYGMELEVAYTVKKGTLYIQKPKTGEVLDTWHIMFLDENYMCMDMGDVRVFFTHSRPQE